MLIYGNPVTDWAAAFAVFAPMYVATMAGWLAIEKVVDRRRERGDAGQTE